jgi:hypothetical protein
MFTWLRTKLEKWRKWAEEQWWLGRHGQAQLMCDKCGNKVPLQQGPLRFHEGACCRACRKVWCLSCQPEPGVNVMEIPAAQMPTCPSCGKRVWPV